MKLIDIKDNLAFHIHKLASIYLSEMTKFLKLSNTKEKELLKKPQKLILNNIKFDSNSNSYVIESMPQRNANLVDEDMLSQEDEEGMEESDSLGEEDENSEESNEDFYYSLSNSENEEDEELEDLDEEDEIFENEEEDESERDNINNNLNNQNLEMNDLEEEKNSEEEDIVDEENSAEEEEFEDESELENLENNYENSGENDEESKNILLIFRC